ncbi:MAG TPA: hypothetical protein VGJ60_28065 [Chloroflexota bacterium]|jgi:hypothetical protein
MPSGNLDWTLVHRVTIAHVTGLHWSYHEEIFDPGAHSRTPTQPRSDPPRTAASTA